MVNICSGNFHARVRGSVPGLGGLKETKLFLPHPRVKVSIVGSLRDREVACSASERQGSNFESCVWRTVSSQSSHHPQEVLLAQFSLYVHKSGLKPDSFHFICSGKCDTEDGVNDMFHKFTQVLTDIAEPFFGKSYNVARSTTSSLSKWMLEECKNLRDAFFFNNLNQYRQNEMDECRNNMIRSRSAYTRCAWSFRREYDHAFMNNML